MKRTATSLTRMLEKARAFNWRTSLEILLAVIGTTIAIQQYRLANSQNALTLEMKRTTDLDRYDRLAEKVRARARDAERHYQELHDLRMNLDRASMTETSRIAFRVSNVATYIHDESLLMQLLEPFLAEPQQKTLHALNETIAAVERARESLFSRGLGPLMVRAYRLTKATRHTVPEASESLYEALSRGGIAFTPEDLSAVPATEEEKVTLYKDLLAYEQAVQEKARAISGLEGALAMSILGHAK